MEFFRSWRESPKVPRGWRPAPPPGAVRKFAILNRRLLLALQARKPGRWVKVYHRGIDGTQVHYCQHESGWVFDVEYKG